VSTRRPEASNRSRIVRGPFEVKLQPQPEAENVGFPGQGRLALDKVFHGGLEATARGQMLSFRSPVDGSAGDVAMERVTGTLEGRQGSFVLQHSGLMDRGTRSLSITVVPDSGTDALTGLRGSMSIEIAEGGAHSYELEYTLP